MLTLTLALGLGWDSLRASAALGTLETRPRRHLLIALLFGICDGGALLVGLVAGRSLAAMGSWPWTNRGLAALVFAYGVYLAFADESGNDPDGRSRWPIWWMPVLLSFDNLAAGIGLIPFDVSIGAALTVGAASAIMSAGGFSAGRALAVLAPAWAETVGGLSLAVIGLLSLLHVG